MNTTQLTELNLRTANKLTSMFTENTGRSFLDSGSAYGRNWEANQGLETKDFLAQKSATWERDYGVTLNTFSYLNARLTYSKTAEVLTRLMHVWELSDYDNRNLYDLSAQESYLEHLGATFGNCWNTYNYDNLLSQIVQGYDFELFDNRFILLQVHGGCDARGGYTLPVIFEVCCEYWLHGCQETELYCDTCHLSGQTYDLSEWYRHGELETPLFGDANPYVMAPEGYDLVNGCPSCGGDLEATDRECAF